MLMLTVLAYVAKLEYSDLLVLNMKVVLVSHKAGIILTGGLNCGVYEVETLNTGDIDDKVFACTSCCKVDDSKSLDIIVQGIQ